VYFLIYKIFIGLLFVVMPFNKKAKEFYFKRTQKIGIQIEGSAVWIHASSVGEVNLSQTLVEKIMCEKDVILSVMTDTGLAQAQQMYKGCSRVHPIYFPLDNVRCINHILKRNKIELLILIETEIWPNLITQVSKCAKVMLVNGRISDKSIKSYKKLKFIFKRALSRIDFFLMQTQLDCERIIEIGALKSRVAVMGNLKYCLEIPQFSSVELELLKERFSLKNRKVITLGSTHEKEEAFFLTLFQEMKSNEKLFLVPRHITRLAEIESFLDKHGVEYTLFNSEVPQDKKVIIVNKMGVLRRLYALSDVCFVGGTLDETGGHNLLEPLYFKRLSLFGPNTRNAKEIARELKAKKLGIEFETVQEFRALIEESDQLLSCETQSRIEAFFSENSRALKIVEEQIRVLLVK